MANWFPPELDPETRIETSESGFTSDEIAVIWLRHYIEHSDAGPDSEWKLLIMDNHGSHTTAEFIRLANENHILPYPLIPHMTHCMQPLDVGIFQPYKHWHDVKIQESVANLNVEYCIRSFLRDLGWIRQQTFKKETIRHAFEKSGMWPVNCQKAIAQVKTFSPPEAPRPDTRLPAQPGSPRGAAQVDTAWTMFEHDGKLDKMLAALSSPSRQEAKTLFSRNREALAHSMLSDAQLNNLKRKHDEDQQRKMKSRKVVQKFGGLTAGVAEQKLQEKERKAAAAEQRKIERSHAKFVREEKKAMYRKGVEDRKAERERKKLVKDLETKGEPVPEELMMPIEDREKVWKEAQIGEEGEDDDDSDDDVSLIINNDREPSPCPEMPHRATPELQQDFLPFPSSPPDHEWCQRATSEDGSSEDLGPDVGHWGVDDNL